MPRSDIREILKPQRGKAGGFARLPPLCDLIGTSMEGTLVMGHFGDPEHQQARAASEIIGASVSLRTIETLHHCGEDAADRWLARNGRGLKGR